MSKKLEKEIFAPLCASHPAGERFVERMGSQDVLGETPDNGQVLRGVVLAGTGVVLVEDDVQGPMKLILDDLSELCRRNDSGQGRIADGGF